MSVRTIQRLLYPRVREGNEATTKWLMEKLNSHGMYQPDLNPNSQGNHSRAVIRRESEVGAWNIRNGTWEDKFKTLLAAPPTKNETGKSAEQDLEVAIPGLGYRSIMLSKDGHSVRHLGVFVKPGELELFDPYSGIWSVDSTTAKAWFAQHMKKYYSSFNDALFFTRVLAPKTTIYWDLANADESKIAYAMAKALDNGHVAFGKYNDTFLPKKVLWELIRIMSLRPVKNQKTTSIQAFFIQNYYPSCIQLPAREHFQYLIKGSEKSLAKPEYGIIDEITDFTRSVPLYAFDPIVGNNGSSVSQTNVDVRPGGLNTKKIRLKIRGSDQSGENKRISNWNMAKIFSELAGERGGVILCDSDVLVDNPNIPPTYRESGQPRNFLPTQCGVSHVFDFSGIDRSNQKVRNVEFIRGIP